MTAAADLLDHAEAAGLRLALDRAGRVRVRGRLAPDLLAALRAERGALAVELRRRDLAAAMAARAEALEGIMDDPDVLADREAIRLVDGYSVGGAEAGGAPDGA